MPQQNQLHILIGCADARDLNQLQLDVVADKIKEFASRGKKVQLQVIRAAGSFISPDVYDDLRHIILNYQKEVVVDPNEVGYYVHIQSHGHLTPESSKEYISHVHEMKIVDGSPLNCGMLGASSVGVEIEELILDKRMKYRTPDGERQVTDESGLRTLLRDVYAYDGFLAGDWIRSIDLLRTHPRTQKARLESLLRADPELRRLNIQITAGIQDYSIHGLIRLDGGDPKVLFWDEVQHAIRENAALHLETLQAQGEKQKPLAGLICMADPRMSSRLRAAHYYYTMKGLPEPTGYLANTVFNITGSTFDIPGIPFGPYAITGFYYSVRHLGLRDQMVMGYDTAQTDRILMKIHSDPIMDLIVKSLDVQLIPINHSDIK